MRIFIAGATGTLGRPVVRLLLSHGHELVALTRSPERARSLTAHGVRAVVGDALDREVLKAQVVAAHPDRVLHLLTALPPNGPLRKSHLAATNELRTKATANLIESALEAEADRLVAESFVTVYDAVPSDRRIGEQESLSPVAPGVFAETIAALRSLEEQLQHASLEMTTVALRIGFLYGSDVPTTRELVRQARARRLFVPRNFTGVGPFVHVADAASAIVAAIEHPRPSAIYNVMDDQPLALTTFIGELTTAIGAPPARHVPRWLVRLTAPVMAEFGSASLILVNDRIKRELGWMPRYPTVESGMAEVKEALAQAA